MDENNNPAPSVEETEQMTVPRVKNLDPKLFVAVVVLIVVVVGIVITILGKTQNSEQTPGVVPAVTPDALVPNIPETTSSETKRTEYKNEVPPGYPAQIPVQEDSKLIQSYSKEYPTQMYQMSTLYSSEKDSATNVAFYKNFMVQDGWVITASSTSEKTSSFQANKGSEMLEVIVRKRPDPSNLSSTTTKLMDLNILSYITINVFRK